VTAAVARAGPQDVETPEVAAPSVGASGRRALEDERDFCLRSLRDLDAERDAGDIDEADYRSLKDAYTARAATALHALAGGPPADDGVTEADAGSRLGADEGSRAANGAAPAVDRSAPAGSAVDGSAPAVEATELGAVDGAGPTRRRHAHPRRRAALIAVGVVAIAVVAAWAVVASSATRLPGEEISGVALGPQALAQSLQQAEQAAERGDDLTAVKDYQKILDSNPNQTEALAGEGWLLAQTQQPSLLKQGLTMLQQAERADPTYAPAHVYRGISLLSEDDYTDAIPELKWYLAHSPDPQLAPQVRAALQQAETRAGVAPAAKG
jgi:hypothetical protein